MKIKDISTTSILLLIIGLLIGGLVVFAVTQLKTVNTSDNKSVDKIDSEKSDFCKKYDLEKEDYLEKYTVKKGDTITSIATKELGDSNKGSQIVLLNSESLYINSPLEEGQKIFIPKDEYSDSKGLIYPVVGKVLLVKGSLLGVGTTAGSESYRTVEFEHPDKLAAIKKGDCVEVILDKGNFNKPVSIKKQ